MALRPRARTRSRVWKGSGFRPCPESPPMTSLKRLVDLAGPSGFPAVGRPWLVGEDGETMPRCEGGWSVLEHLRVRPRSCRAGGRCSARETVRARRGVSRSRPAAVSARSTSTAAPSPTMLVTQRPRKSRRAELGQESIDGLGKVAAGVDQRAIEIEDHETNHRFHLSATVGATGLPELLPNSCPTHE